jgi:hypothetical protein
VLKFHLSLVLYLSQVCLQHLSKVPDSQSSCSLHMSPLPFWILLVGSMLGHTRRDAAGIMNCDRDPQPAVPPQVSLTTLTCAHCLSGSKFKISYFSCISLSSANLTHLIYLNLLFLSCKLSEGSARNIY